MSGTREAAVHRLHVDWTRCDGHGACTELLPDLLARDEWGYPVVLGPDRDAAVGPRRHRAARRAVDACPLLALGLVAVPGPDAGP